MILCTPFFHYAKQNYPLLHCAFPVGPCLRPLLVVIVPPKKDCVNRSKKKTNKLHEMNKEIKKKYCDRNFKTQLARALKANAGEAGNIDKIKKFVLLVKYYFKFLLVTCKRHCHFRKARLVG